MPEAMRRDVRLLGDVLGQVISEAGGDDLLRDVEKLRHAVIAARSGAQPSGGEQTDIEALVAAWPVERAELVARAFTVYFHLANLAEELHRIRTLRERDTGDEPLKDSIADALSRVDPDLAGLRIYPVFTAHPTEARRRAVTAALRRIAVRLAELDDPRPGASARAEALRALREEVDLLWRTSELRSRPMSPIDEVRTVLSAFDETLFRLIPKVYRSMDFALEGEASGRVPSRVPAFLRYGSWVGADRDGNPNVTASVTREAAVIGADHALRALEAATTRIGRALTVQEDSAPPSPELRRLLTAATSDYPELLGEILARSPQEPYRTALLYMAQRLQATRTRNLDMAYGGPAEFLADLRVVQESLAAAGATRQAFGELQHLIWQAETFGFHAASLEVRQHSKVHAAALAELRAGDPPSPMTAEVLDTIRAMAWIQRRYGPDAARRYIVSFTRSADDIAAVYELAEYAGEPLELQVIPLFESGEDLANAPSVLSGMIAARPADHLEVMLGYSDSAKELGPASATLSLFRAQAELAQWSAENGVKLTLFHGRGGALGRGGGPAGRAVRAQAPGSVDNRFKVTEQGEVIFARYGQLAIGERHLEQVTSAVLEASTQQHADRTAAVAATYDELASQVDLAARQAFRTLVESPGFPEWFARVSPLDELSRLRIGSRPARRGLAAPASLDDLRAIPWVFSWSQTRINLPGWYGLGSGLAAADLDELRRAYAEWPLFTVLLDNAEMSLAKTDRSIASRYLSLGDRPDLTELVLAEYDLTRRLVLQVTGHSRLLENRTVLSRAVALRDPYVDALSYLQLRALRALRTPDAATAPDHDRLERLLLLTVSGVSAGLQNTG
ncbi:MAG: phosphoenolpyruvate carboxylase [Streptosporangiaceae bacterium]|jgi:phosphoenolpyruvate carboxylase